MEEKKIFDKRFVHFMWDASLQGKEGFFADYIDKLVDYVENGIYKLTCKGFGTSQYPFSGEETQFCFFYYDPLYEVKWAWKQGKTIQVRSIESALSWLDWYGTTWIPDCYEYRVKPENKWRPFKDIQELKQAWENKRSLHITLELEEPTIWVRKKNSGITSLIDRYDYRNSKYPIAVLGRKSMQELFDEWEFLDGTPCGVEE